MTWLDSPLLTFVSAAAMLAGAVGAHNLNINWLAALFLFGAGFATMLAIVLWAERR